MKPYSIFLLILAAVSSNEKARQKTMRFTTGTSTFFNFYIYWVLRFSFLRPSQVLVCRLIDRPLRPTMPKGFYFETQILSWVIFRS